MTCRPTWKRMKDFFHFFLIVSLFGVGNSAAKEKNRVCKRGGIRLTATENGMFKSVPINRAKV